MAWCIMEHVVAKLQHVYEPIDSSPKVRSMRRNLPPDGTSVPGHSTLKGRLPMGGHAERKALRQVVFGLQDDEGKPAQVMLIVSPWRCGLKLD